MDIVSTFLFGFRNIQNLHLILKSNDEEKLTYVSKVVLYAKDEMSSSCKRAKLDGNLTGLGVWKQINVLNPRRKATFIGKRNETIVFIKTTQKPLYLLNLSLISELVTVFYSL